MIDRKNKLSVYLILCLLSTNGILWAQNTSVLASGNWFKFSVTTEGVYRIDYNLLRNSGVNPDQINPRQIKLYSSHSGMLPQANNSTVNGELRELAIFVSGEEDGRFNSNDYILFFAKGPDQVEFNQSKQIFQYVNNLYSDKNYFFLTIGQDNGKRINIIENIIGSFPIVNSYDDFAFYETEKYNILKSGRQWFGEQFDAALEATIRFDVSGIIENSDVRFVSQVMGQSISNCTFDVFINNNLVLTQPISAIPNTSYGIKGRTKSDTIKINTSSINASSQSNLDVKYRFTKGGSGLSVGYLDLMLLSFKRKLSLYGDQTVFRSGSSTENNISTYEISNSSTGLSIWNITDYFNVSQQSFSTLSNKVVFSANSSSLQTFILFTPSKTKSAVFESKIQNQNLHHASAPELLIISHPNFLSDAMRLASHRQNHSGISVTVATTEQIYNEFSGGRQDVTAIRNFIRYLFDQPASPLRNVLLFGRGSYDYKNRILSNTNYVPIYESRNSLSPLETYSSDDYFGFLEPNEGDWMENPIQNHTLDVGIGRLPVKNTAEAKQVVDKLIEYDLKLVDVGLWQNEFLFVADDGDFNIHQNQADQIANSIELYDPVFTARKFYLDSFEQVERPNGQFSPDAQKALDLEIRKGALIVNFTGHGSERVWMDERVLDEKVIQNWKQGPRYPLFLTATCEFGRNDDPLQISSGEFTLLQKSGGSIGIVSTARPVSASTNFTLNKAFYEALFKKENNQFRELGTIFRETKNNSISGVSNRNFSLLGDPSLKLALYKNDIVIDEIKNSKGSDDIQGLSGVIVKGHVETNNQVNSDYSGIADIILYDGLKEYVTKGDENPVFFFTARNNVLFRGSASVNNGLFEAEFIMPKNSPQTFTIGKLSAIAGSASVSNEAAGAFYKNLIGGVDPLAGPDTNPPMVRLFMGDTTFINGGVVGPNSKIVALFFDENGINISGQPDSNNLTAQIDQGEPVVLNDYFQSDLDNFKKGSVIYPVDNLEKGKHSLSLNVSDSYNNMTIASIDFIVTDGVEIEVEEFSNYPNPFYESTTFEFTHTRPGEDLEAILNIYDLSGKNLLTQEYFVPASQYRVTLTEWDGKTATGTKLSRGLYLSKISVRSLLDGSKNEQFTKLIIVN